MKWDRYFFRAFNPCLDFPFWYSTYETTTFSHSFSHKYVLYVCCGGRQYKCLYVEQGLLIILLMFCLSASSNMNLNYFRWICSHDDKSTFIMNESFEILGICIILRQDCSLKIWAKWSLKAFASLYFNKKYKTIQDHFHFSECKYLKW